MHAIVAESADQLVWQQVPDAVPGRGEVLIKVSAAGVNRADLLQAAGYYPPPPGASELLGMEVSGVVATVGDEVSGWTAGQEVCACWRAADTPNTSLFRPVNSCRFPAESTCRTLRAYRKWPARCGRIWH